MLLFGMLLVFIVFSVLLAVWVGWACKLPTGPFRDRDNESDGSE